MATIVVEVRKQPVWRSFLDRMADTALALGHAVLRWRGPLSGRMPDSRYLPQCDAAVLVNGAHAKYRPIVTKLRARGTATLYLELGWHPQAGMFQVDHAGVNSAASWANDPLPELPFAPLNVRASGDLLALLQLDDDTQITERSPWFRDMEAFVRFAAENSRLPLRVRAHPLARNLARLRAIVTQAGAAWDDSPSIAAALTSARAVACVNSSAGVAALSENLPVLCCGEAVYRHAGAAYCLTNQAAAFQRATTEIAAGQCSLNRLAVEHLTQCIVSRQWRESEIAVRLPLALEQAFAHRTIASHSRPALSDSLEYAWRSILDWPAARLYRARRWKAAG